MAVGLGDRASVSTSPIAQMVGHSTILGEMSCHSAVLALTVTLPCDLQPLFCRERLRP